MIFRNRPRRDRKQAHQRQRETRRRRLGRWMSRTPQLESLEDRRLLATVDVVGNVLTFNNNGVEQNDLTISLDSSGNLVLQEAGYDITGGAGVNDLSADARTLVIAAADFAAISKLQINTHSGDDLVTIDLSEGNPIPLDGIDYDGGAGGFDELAIQGGSADTVVYTFENQNDGDISIDGSIVNYVGLEPVIDNSDAVNRVFTFTGGAETITLSDDATPGDGFSQIDSTLGEIVTFLNPTGSLTINAGSGADIVNVDGLDSLFAATLTINGDAESDTIRLNTTATATSVAINGNGGIDGIDIGGGSMDLITSPVSVDGGGDAGDMLDLNDFGGTPDALVTVTNSDVTGLSAGAVTYTGLTSLLIDPNDANPAIVNVESTASGVSTLINTGSAGDVITLGLAGSMDGILGPVELLDQGGAGDTIVYDDSADADGDTYVVGADGSLTRGIVNVTVVGGTFEIVELETGPGEDEITVTPGATTTVSVAGGDPATPPGDRLIYVGTPTKTINGAGIGTLSQPGFADVTFQGIETLEASGGVFNDVVNVGALPGGADGDPNEVIIQIDPTGAFIDILFDGNTNDATPAVLFSRQLVNSVNSITVNGAGDADRLTVNHANGLVAINPIEFDGAGGVDSLAVTGDPGVAIARETYTVGATEGAGTWVLDPNDSAGPGAMGTFDGDEMVINFTELEPADTDVPAAVFDVIFGVVANQATLSNGGDLNGSASLLLTDNNATFETFRFANKATVRLSGNAGTDEFELAGTINAAGMDGLEIYGHAAPGIVLGADDGLPDFFSLVATPAGSTTALFGQGGDDRFFNDNNPLSAFGSASQNLDAVVGPISFDGGANGANGDHIALLDDNSGAGVGDTVTLTSTQLAGAAPAMIDYTQTEFLTYGMTTLADTLDILSTAAGAAYLLSGEDGADTFSIGIQTAAFSVNPDGSLASAGGSLDAIQGAITIQPDGGSGTSGTDIINVDDSGTAALNAAASINNAGATVITDPSGETYTGASTSLVGFAPVTISYFHDDTAGTFNIGTAGNRLEQLNVFGSDGVDTIAVNATTAINTTRLDVHDGNDSSTVTINGDALSANNIFHGSAGNDQTVLNITTDIGATAFVPVTSVEIWGDANAGPTTGPADNRDRLIINDNNAAAARQLNYDYLDVAGLIPAGSLDISPITVNNGLFGANAGGNQPLNIRSMETVIFNGTGTDDITRVTGTSQDDDLTVALRNNNSSAFVFLNGNPYATAPPDSLATNLPGVAGGGAGPDLLINGINNAGANQGIRLDGSGTNATGNRAIVQAASEDAVVTGGTTDIWNLGAGVLIPGFGAGNAFDAIAVNGAAGVDPGIGAVGSAPNQVVVNNTSAGLLVPVTVDAGSFVNGAAPSSRAGLIVNGGDEAAARAIGIADNFFATSHPLFNIGVNGNLPPLGPTAPDGFPAGDQLNWISATSFNIFSDKVSPPNVSITAGNSPFGLINSSIERTRLSPGNGTVNLIGDNNDPAVDQTDNFVVTGLDIDPGGSPDGGVQEMAVVINGSAPILIDDVQKLNAFGYDLNGQNLDNPNPNAVDTPADAATANDIDTLEITPFADNAGGPGANAPRGWGVQAVFNEGSPAGEDGDQSDLLILHTSIGVNAGLNVFGGGIVSENIVVQPSGPDNGEVRVTNALDGSAVVNISYINNTDLIVLDDDGAVSDTDTLTLRGTNPDTPQVSGNDSFEVDFDATQGVNTPLVTARDSNTGAILYRLRGFTDPVGGAQSPIASVSFDMLAGNDSMTFEAPSNSPFTSGVDQVQVFGGAGDDSVAVDYGTNEDVWHDGRLTYDGGTGSDILSLVGDANPDVTDVVYTPGPIAGAGTISSQNTLGGGPQIIDFVNLEPVFDFSVAANLTINADNAANAISYFTDNGAGTLGAITAGAGYTNGVYLNVPLTGGSGTGARADITVAGNAVTVVTLVNDGSGYTIGDALSAADANLGGGGGTNFSIPVASFSGTVAIDNQEVLVFANKTNLTINGNGGSDEISLNNPITPAGLTNVTVNGGDPTGGSDTLVVNARPGTNDALELAFTGTGAGLIESTGVPDTNFTGIEGLTTVFQTNEQDSLDIDGTAGNDQWEFTHGETSDTATIRGDLNGGGANPFAMVPTTYTGLNLVAGSTQDVDINVGSTAVGNTGGTDSLKFNGTSANDVISTTDSGGGDVRINNTINGVLFANIDFFDTGGDETLLVRGHAGSDIFNHSAQVDVVTSYEGGTPDAGSDFLNISGDPTAGTAETVLIQADATNPTEQDIQGLGPAATVDVNVADVELIRYTGSGGDDTLTVELQNGVATARVRNATPANTDEVTSNVLPAVQFAAVQNFVLDGSDDPTTATFVLDDLEGATNYTFASDDETDTLVIEGDGGADAITASLNAGNLRVAGSGSTIDTTGMTATDLVQVNSLGGNDTLTVSAAGTALISTPIEYDGGTGSDALTVSGTPSAGNVPDEVIYTPGTALTEGHLLYEDAANARLMSIDFVNLAPVNELLVAANLTVNGTNANNAINYTQGANATLGRVTVDGFERIDFQNKTNLNINALAGSDRVDLSYQGAAAPTGLTSVTVNGGDGNDVVDGSPLAVATALTLNGGVGADTLIGGPGADTLAGGAGDDSLILDIGNNAAADTFDGGTGFDRMIIRGTGNNDVIDVVQAAPAAPYVLNVTTTVGAAAAVGPTAHQLTAAGALPAPPTIEEVKIEAADGNDSIRVAHDQAYFAAPGLGPQMVRFAVDGGSPNASDRLFVQDLGIGDVVLVRQAPDNRSGRITVAPGLAGIGETVYSNIENVDITPVNPVTGGSGSDGAGQVVVFQTDPFELNDNRLIATEIGDVTRIAANPNIDPGNAAIFGNPDGDEDWYEFRAAKIGTFQFDVLFDALGPLANGQPGLPGNGALAIGVYSAAAGGTLIASGSVLNNAGGTPIGQRVQFSAAANTNYFLRVTGAPLPGNAVSASAAINTYDVNLLEVDLLGPQVFDPDGAGPNQAIQINADPTFDLFAVKPPRPTPAVNSLTINLRDLPIRAPGDLYGALGPTANAPGNYQLVGDQNGVIPIANVTVVNAPPVVGSQATATVRLDFSSPLPDDRFTLTLLDSIRDPAGNKLDGESNADEPATPTFPSGDGVSGGDFVARFTVDSRAELGVWSGGSVYVDTNGNFRFDPDNSDASNRDIVYTLGFATDHIFSGNFAAAGAVADGFDKLAAYSRTSSGFRWLIDFNNDGVPDPPSPITTANIVGIPVAGNFDGNAANGDEVGLFTGTTWVFDRATKDYNLGNEARVASDMRGLPIVGDFDNDGTDDLGTYTSVSNTFNLSLSSLGGGINNPNTTTTFRIGNGFPFIGVRSRPVAGDVDADGFDDIGLWVPDRSGVTPSETAEWYIFVSGGASVTNRIRNQAGTQVIDFTPTPFGNDLFAQFGDEFGIPLLGNFDPPLPGAAASQSPPVNSGDTGNDGTSTNEGPLDPAPINPAPLVSAPIDPAPLDPAPIDPAPIDPAPIDPAPIDPAPIDPAPIDPAPIDPAPIDSAPANPFPGDPPVNPAPVDPAPVDPAPVDPAPVDPAPVDPAPVDPAPIDPAPIDPAPASPTPVDPPPVDPPPVDPAPTTSGDDATEQEVVVEPATPSSNTNALPDPTTWYHNAALPEDVNGDGVVRAQDAIIVINALSEFGLGALPVPLEGSTEPRMYIDVVGNGRLAGLDVLLVLNYLTQQSASSTQVASPNSGGEGEYIDDAMIEFAPQIDADGPGKVSTTGQDGITAAAADQIFDELGSHPAERGDPTGDEDVEGELQPLSLRLLLAR